MAKNRIAGNGEATQIDTDTNDPKKIIAAERAKLHAEFNTRLAALCEEYGIDIVPQTVLLAKFRQ